MTLNVAFGGSIDLLRRPALRLPDGTPLPMGHRVLLLVEDYAGDVAAVMLEPAEVEQLAQSLLAMLQP